MAEIRINLNDSVKVKLTDLGKDIFYHQYDRLNSIFNKEICKPSMPKVDEDGYTTFQLWEFMELYGVHMGMTLPNVIEPLDMVFDAPTIEPEPHWIPTSKKPDPDLPEEDMSGYFLVTLHTYGNIGFDMDEYEVKKMRWDRVNGWVLPVHSPAWIEDALTQDVLAWKPCPEPYREGGE